MTDTSGPLINCYAVQIFSFDSDIPVDTIGTMTWLRKAEKVQRGVNTNLNHDDYYTDITWFGPDPEPTQP